ncbi:hypothetical protein ACGF4C_37830 [Streptomyces sp. NPDC048197]|uniref:hypothetical protein n=1 Tax=Streptomyces sp. NPDC048197 TaxID=3365511 RepID=UPI0037206589
MWRRDTMRKSKRKGKTETVRLELCDLCAATFAESEAVRGYVPDSSSVSSTNDWFDGLRRITACGSEHFAVVKALYTHRPFVQEELWAAKITRALAAGPPVLSVAELACRTGLHEPEIGRAIAWHNERKGSRTTPWPRSARTS